MCGQNWRSPTMHSASGRLPAKSGRQRASSAAGCTRSPMLLAKPPKSQQPKAKRALQEIWMAETKADAEVAFDAFIESYQVQYDKAAECLNKDRGPLLAFYDLVFKLVEAAQKSWRRLDGNNQLPKTRSRCEIR